MASFDIGTGSPLAASVRKKHTKALVKYILVVVGVFTGMGLYLLFVPLEVQAQAPGEVQAYHSTDVYAPLKGLVKEVLVSCGEEVKEGQALAVLECPGRGDLVAETEEELERSREELQVLKSMVSDLKELVGRDDFHDNQLLRERIESLKVRTTEAVRCVEERVARLQTPMVTLRAPVKGILSEWESMPGDVVTDEKPVGRILRNDVIRIRAHVSEGEISEVEVGQIADVRFAVKPWRQHGVFQGTVTEIGTHVQRKKTDGPGRCSVGILVEDAPSNIIEGSTVDVRIKTSEDSPIQRLLGG